MMAINDANLSIILLVFLLGVLNVYLQYSKWRLTCKEVLGVEQNQRYYDLYFTVFLLE